MENGAAMSIRPTVYYVSQTLTHFNSSSDRECTEVAGAAGLQRSQIEI